MRVDDNPIPLQIIGGNQLLEAPKSAATQCDQKNTQGQKRVNERNDNKGNKTFRLLDLSELTPLNNTPENIYLAIKDAEDYPEPRPIKGSDHLTKSGKFCWFHNQPGHNANKCSHLKSLIEELIRKNRMQQ